jgi:hypothetical protein
MASCQLHKSSMSLGNRAMSGARPTLLGRASPQERASCPMGEARSPIDMGPCTIGA